MPDTQTAPPSEQWAPQFDIPGDEIEETPPPEEPKPIDEARSEAERQIDQATESLNAKNEIADDLARLQNMLDQFPQLEAWFAARGVQIDVDELCQQETANQQTYFDERGFNLDVTEMVTELEAIRNLPIEGGTVEQQQAIRSGFAELIVAGGTSADQIQFAFRGGIKITEALSQDIGQTYGADQLEGLAMAYPRENRLEICHKLFAPNIHGQAEDIPQRLAHELGEILGDATPAGLEKYGKRSRIKLASKLSGLFDDAYVWELKNSSSIPADKREKIIAHEQDCQLYAFCKQVPNYLLPPCPQDEAEHEEAMERRARAGSTWMLLQRLNHMRPEDQQKLTNLDTQTMATLKTDLEVMKELFRAFDEINLRTKTIDELGNAERSEESGLDELEYMPFEYLSTGSLDQGLGGGGKNESAIKVVLDALDQFNPFNFKKVDI